MQRAAALLPVSRAEWLGARAALAGRRIGRFALGAVATFLTVLLVLLVIPQLGVTVNRPQPVVSDVIEDTIPLIRAATEAQHALARAESLYQRALDATARGSDAREGLSLSQRSFKDSLQALLAELDSLLDRSAKAPLQASYKALTLARALKGEPRAVLLTDSLAVLERRRAALVPNGGTERSFANLTTQMNDVGLTIRDVAERRRTGLIHQLADLDSSTQSAGGVDTTTARESRDVAGTWSARALSSLAAARRGNAARDRRQVAARDRANRRVPPIAMLAAATVLSMIIGFSASLVMEIARPTIANAREAESVAHCPVVVVAHADQTPAAATGLDPFRMLYLGLTETGARITTVEICGDERAVVATVAGRLALAAAGDASATLVVDADAEGSPVAGYYRQRPEPGFTDAMAGVRLWREVTRPVGASDGLAIDVVSGGSLGRKEPDATTRDAARQEFARIRAEYDFCVAVGSSDAAIIRLNGLLEGPTVLLCAVVGRTTLASLIGRATRLRAGGASLHGIALWDAEMPYIAHRNELMARELTGHTADPG
ncbi:MAG TPA: hypothetical protein VHE78_02325 [Gemmatimonadaceae bacterium]|nr:hypothetical protein [Gemmatimonadaceae bacterium]